MLTIVPTVRWVQKILRKACRNCNFLFLLTQHHAKLDWESLKIIEDNCVAYVIPTGIADFLKPEFISTVKDIGTSVRPVWLSDLHNQPSSLFTREWLREENKNISATRSSRKQIGEKNAGIWVDKLFLFGGLLSILPKNVLTGRRQSVIDELSDTGSVSFINMSNQSMMGLWNLGISLVSTQFVMKMT